MHPTNHFIYRREKPHVREIRLLCGFPKLFGKILPSSNGFVAHKGHETAVLVKGYLEIILCRTLVSPGS
jgi:hypothetical protein